MTSDTIAAITARLKRDERGLVPVIAQQHDTGQVLMLAWMDTEALRRTLNTGRVTYWSRSRREYWRKGDTSGYAQYLKHAFLDCDGDTILLLVDQVGPACHTGALSCFESDGGGVAPEREAGSTGSTPHFRERDCDK